MELIKEQQFFINILKDFLLENYSVLQDDLDWNLIQYYTNIHQVGAIFYRQTKQKIFQNVFSMQIYRYKNYEKEVCLFREALKDYQYLLVKGIIVAELYPIPSLRSMGDVDILIHSEDRENIHNILIDNGFELQKITSIGEWTYSKKEFLFEVHDSLVHRYKGKEQLVDYFLNCWNYAEDGELGWSFHLIYLIEHLRQHFVGRGVGFRQFMDVAIVCKKCDIDWKFVSIGLKKLNLYDFATTVFAFIDAWFDIQVPFPTRELSEEFYVKSTQKVFSDGVFGANNSDNSTTALSFQMHYKGVEFNKARRDYFLDRLFPDQEYMSHFPHCSYVEKSKLLLPVSWIQRFLYCVFNKEHRSYIKQQFLKKKTMERINMLNEWGLK